MTGWRLKKGLGQCTWYRSRHCTPSRPADSTARHSATGPTGNTGNNLVAMNASSRRPATAEPTMRSEAPKP